jgi:hypothetical protein
MNSRSELNKIIRDGKSKCTSDVMKNTSPEFRNRRIQCELFNMERPASLTFRQKFGSGVQGTVNRFTIQSEETIPETIRESESDNLALKTDQHRYFNTETKTIIEDDVKKQEFLNASELDLKSGNIEEKIDPNSNYTQELEALIGLKLNSVSDMTPNFPYYYDIRSLPRFSNEKKRMIIPHTSEEKNELGRYGIITETITGITFHQFLKQAKIDPIKRIQISGILKQILFSIYIASKKLGFSHFDLHTNNILITNTREPIINYKIPSESKFLYNKQINTDGNLVKMIDFGFSFINIDNQLFVSDYTKNLYGKCINFEDIEGTRSVVPTESYISIDMWRVLIEVYRAIYGDPLAQKDFLEFFGDYSVRLIKALKIRKGQLSERVKKREITTEQYNNWYASIYKRYVLYLVNTNMMTDEMKNNDVFLEKCLKFIDTFQIRLMREAHQITASSAAAPEQKN